MKQENGWAPEEGRTRFGKEKSLLLLLGMEPRYLGCPARRLDTILPELSRIPTTFMLLFKLISSLN